ncbi:MAG: tetratricopeptide repeat protein, partial [Isosphaeraceae bacterium]
MSRSNRNAPIRTTRVNVSAVAVVIALALVVGPGLYALNLFQARRISQEALASAARLRDAGEPDLAVRNLDQHLARNPGDVDALGMKSEILASVALRSGNPGLYIDAARVHEQFLRVAPNDPASQDVRRRLIELYVKYGDALKAMASTEFANLLATLDSRYRAAEMVARQHISRGATDPGARRLLAMALDGLAVPGNPKAQSDAVEEYRRVLSMDPGDIEAAERLAKLYLERLKDTPRAELVLNDLLRANPDSVKVRLARHRFFDKIRKDREAAEELEQATRMAPNDVEVILAAAENALKRGKIEEARRQLAKVPENLKSDVRVLLTRGLIEFGDERPGEAVDAWRQGLSTSAGTNGEVTWWLAYTLLQLGKVPESRPLIEQFARLNPGDTPLLRLLQAQYDERTGRPARALASLDQIRQKLDPKWEGLVHLARGRCHEALWDDLKAIDSYNAAMQTDPLAVVPRLAIAKLKVRRTPREAIDLISRGLELIPGDPALRIAMAGALLRQEMGQPPARRGWSEFDRAWRAAAEVSPKSSVVALLWADRLAGSGRPDEALKYLQQVADGSPDNLPVAIALAEGMTRLDQPEAALAVLDRAAKAGDSASLRVARARTLTALYRGREARAALIRDVDKLEPSDQGEIWIALGQIETARGDDEAARQAYAEWARLQPEDPRPRLVLLELALTEGNETAIKTLVQELRLSAIDPRERGTPNSPVAAAQANRDLAYRLAHAKELIWERDKAKPPEGSRDEQLEEAGRLVESVLEEAPTLPAASMMKAQVLERQGKLAEAVVFYEQAYGKGVGSAVPRL